jgi:hypothetical protein
LELSGPAAWQCPGCGHHLRADPGVLPACAVCGSAELYKKKDFPHGLGLAILTVACLVSFVTYGLYEKWLTWAILIGTALFDGLLYLWVGDAVVCYRCGAVHRGLVPAAGHRPFELSTAERYRQERLRRERLQAARKSAGA